MQIALDLVFNHLKLTCFYDKCINLIALILYLIKSICLT